MKHASRDSLLSISSSSSSNRRSSLLSQENSITEECEDDVFEDDDERSTLPEEDVNILDNDEVEISTNFEVDNKAENNCLEWSTANGINDTVDMSGVEPLDKTEDDEMNGSVSGVYDSFSEDTAEESIGMSEDSLEAETNEKLEHAKRRILQDSTILSTCSGNDLDNSAAEMEIVSKSSGIVDVDVVIPTIEVHDATVTGGSVGLEVNDDRCESPDEILASPASVYHTAPTSRRHTSLGGVISPSFDTTAEEMALFEMYGEDYDDIVAAMTHEERVELGAKIAGRGEEELKEVAQKLKKIMDESRARISSASSIQSPLRPIVEEAPRLSSIGSNISPFSLASTATATPSPLNATPMSWPVSSPTTVSSSAAVSSNAEIQPSVSESSMLALPSNVSFVNPSNVSAVEDSPVFDNSNLSINMNQTPIFNLPPNVSFDSDKSENEEIVANEADEVDGELRDKEVFEDDPVISAPEPVTSFSNNFMLPTASSLGKMVAHNPPMSPSPRKNPIWMPPSPSPSKLSIGKINSSNKRLQAVSRLPQLIRTPQSQPRPVLTELVNSGIKTPSSIQKKSVTNMKSAYAAVASPVASYVRNNPAPHLVQ